MNFCIILLKPFDEDFVAAMSPAMFGDYINLMKFLIASLCQLILNVAGFVEVSVV